MAGIEGLVLLCFCGFAFVFCVLCFVFCVLCFAFCVLCFAFCVLCFVFCVLCLCLCLCLVSCVLLACIEGRSRASGSPLSQLHLRHAFLQKFSSSRVRVFASQGRVRDVGYQSIVSY